MKNPQERIRIVHRQSQKVKFIYTWDDTLAQLGWEIEEIEDGSKPQNNKPGRKRKE